MKEQKGNGRKELVVYDFRNPSKFSREQLKAIEVMIEKYCAALANDISEELSTIALVELVEVKPILYSEYEDNQEKVCSVIDANPLNGIMLLECELQLVNMVLDRMFGGMGDVESGKKIYTEIEQLMINEVLEQWICLFGVAMNGICQWAPSLRNISFSQYKNQMIPPAETVIRVKIKLSIGSVDSYLYLCIPYLTIEKVKDQLTIRQFLGSQRNGNEEKKHWVSKRIQNSVVLVKAEIGKITLTVEQLLHLSIGDVIQMDHNCEEPINVYVENSLKYKANVENIKNRAAIKIDKLYEIEE